MGVVTSLERGQGHQRSFVEERAYLSEKNRLEGGGAGFLFSHRSVSLGCDLGQMTSCLSTAPSCRKREIDSASKAARLLTQIMAQIEGMGPGKWRRYPQCLCRPQDSVSVWGHQSQLRLRQGWEGKLCGWPGHSPLCTSQNNASLQRRAAPRKAEPQDTLSLGLEVG